ncbi:MAG: FAD-dependent monooxygenase [Actinobacteria bacterium]|nr:FAD-dependent monooxygenase [Actinomycetota bacterium]
MTSAEPREDALDTDVVIVGAGPIGSTLALDLALNGTHSIVLESRGPEDPPHPGNNLTNARTMEHMRRWGATHSLRDANPVGTDIERDVSFVTRANGYMVQRERGLVASPAEMPMSSGGMHFGPQRSIEAGLRARVSSVAGHDFRFNSTFQRYTEHPDHVEVTYLDSEGERRTLNALYLVGADGSGSQVRRQMGIRLEGTEKLGRAAVWYVQAPQIHEVFEETFGYRSAFIWMANEDEGGSVFMAQDSEGLFQYWEQLGPDDDGDDWDAMYKRLCANVGTEVEATPLEGGNIWIRSLVAPRFSDGRVFIAGDAAHLISPFGGLGMNTGIGDVADLGWKLTAAVEGWGGPGLLESYSIDRVPVVSWIRDLTEWSTQHQGTTLSKPGIELPGPEGDAVRKEAGENITRLKQQELASFGAQFGAAYRNSPVCAGDGSEPPEASFGEFTPSTVPGSRLPHLWLGPDHSIFDEVKTKGFTLLRLDRGADPSSFEEAAAERRVPLSVFRLDDAAYAAVCEADLVLVRPDHYVAWRGNGDAGDPGAILDRVRGVELASNSTVGADVAQAD